jgi:hypothetical protein
MLEPDADDKAVPIADAAQFKIAAFSINGGSSWRGGSNFDIAKLLNKELTLWITNAWDSSAKAPAAASGEGDAAVPAAIVIKFPKIEAREKASFAVDFFGGRDVTAETTGRWHVADRSSFDRAAGGANLNANGTELQFILAGSTGRIADGDVWGVTRTENAGRVNVRPLDAGANARPARNSYFVRTTPVIGTTIKPASRPVRLNVAGEQRAPRLRANYRANDVRGRAGTVVSFVDALNSDMTTFGALNVGTGAEARLVAFRYTRENAKENPFKFVPELETFQIFAWTEATTRRPASAQQIINIAPAAKLLDAAIPANGARLQLPRTMEIRNAEGKWGGARIASGTTPATIGPVRMKNTAKADRSELGFNGAGASDVGVIVLTWGKNNRDRDVIIGAQLFGPDYYDGNITFYELGAVIDEEGNLTAQFAVKGVGDLDEDADGLEDYLLASLQLPTPAGAGATAPTPISADIDEVDPTATPIRSFTAAQNTAINAILVGTGDNIIPMPVIEVTIEDDARPGRLTVSGDVYHATTNADGLVGMPDGEVSAVAAITVDADWDAEIVALLEAAIGILSAAPATATAPPILQPARATYDTADDAIATIQTVARALLAPAGANKDDIEDILKEAVVAAAPTPAFTAPGAETDGTITVIITVEVGVISLSTAAITVPLLRTTVPSP